MLKKKCSSPQGNKTKCMAQDADLINYLLLLLFGNVYATSKSTPVLNYVSIAKIVKISNGSVRRLIFQGLKDFQNQSKK